MRKQMVLFSTLLALSAAVVVPVSAQESSSVTSGVTSETVKSEVTPNPYADQDAFNAFHQESTLKYVDAIKQAFFTPEGELTSLGTPERVEKVQAYLEYLVAKELVTGESTAQIDALLEQVRNASTDTTVEATQAVQQGISQSTIDYLKPFILGLYTDSTQQDVAEFVTFEHAEALKQVLAFDLIVEADKAAFKSDQALVELALEMAKYRHYVLSSFNEDGTFKDKLYSKHLLESYRKIKDKQADFVARYAAQHEQILTEINARKVASEAVAKLEEKRKNGESITEEELATVEQALSNVQTETHRQAVVVTQTTETPPAPEATYTPPVAEPVQPVVEEPTAPVYYEIPAGFFASFEEADAYGYSLLNGADKASYQAYTAGFLPDGRAYYGVDFWAAGE
ncbi:MAG: hypothetical protein Q4B80_02370 [Aerococcaceae bacterium]|nr:hypothetical protein [Aerococcaceae bacterium]MDO4432142.1 hypothetical protein [Aerococcaceae bacterium]